MFYYDPVHSMWTCPNPDCLSHDRLWTFGYILDFGSNKVECPVCGHNNPNMEWECSNEKCKYTNIAQDKTCVVCNTARPPSRGERIDLYKKDRSF